MHDKDPESVKAKNLQKNTTKSSMEAQSLGCDSNKTEIKLLHARRISISRLMAT